MFLSLGQPKVILHLRVLLVAVIHYLLIIDLAFLLCILFLHHLNLPLSLTFLVICHFLVFIQVLLIVVRAKIVSNLVITLLLYLVKVLSKIRD